MTRPDVHDCFLSYAPADAQDRAFETFVADFVEELRGAVGAQVADNLVFRHSDVPLGARWESYVDNALLGCRTFIAMLSPSYLQQASCRRQWARFEWRLQAAGGGAPPDLLLPVLWIPIPDGDLPPAVRARQLTHGALGPSYARRGLRSLVQRADVEYRDALSALASRVRDLVRQPALPSRSTAAVPDELLDPFAVEPPFATAGPIAPAASFGSRVRQPATAADPVGAPAARHVILFLAANPSQTTPLALDEECAAIERELRMTKERDSFELRSKWAVSVDDMMRYLNELRPAVIHFSGHGGGSGGVQVLEPRSFRDVALPAPSGAILLHDEQRQSQYVSGRALTQMIASASPATRVVVLNACFSEPVAEALRGVVDCVVGMRGTIGDDAARWFAVGFYRALGHGCSIGNAVAQAVAGLAAKQLPDEHLPICLTRAGIVAGDLRLLRTS